ncbi:MAG: Uma2 family endonuclease [Gemmataceae bacterium]
MTPTIQTDAAAPAERLLTAEEYAALPDHGVPTELVRGRVVEMNVPYPRHGQICARFDRIIGSYVDLHELGHLLINDAGVRTERGPDTVRGPDLSYYSFTRVPKGRLAWRYLDVVPELVFEVRSTFDRWPRIHAKIAEYLEAGIAAVVIADDQTEMVLVYQPDEIVLKLEGDDELHLPAILGDFRVAVRRFFD